MRQRVEKEIYVEEMFRKVQKREMLRNYYNKRFGKVLKKFDGKVYNARFKNAVEEDMYQENVCLGVSEKDKTEKIVRLSLYVQKEQYNYDREGSEYVEVCLKDGRIDAKATHDHDQNKRWWESFDNDTQSVLQTVLNYDEYMKVADDMMEAIKKYNDLPFYFVRNLQTEYIHIHH